MLSCIAVGKDLFSSLAGAYFQIIPVSHPASTTVTVSGKIGLGYNNLSNPAMLTRNA
jgi:hypothetical protein